MTALKHLKDWESKQEIAIVCPKCLREYPQLIVRPIGRAGSLILSETRCEECWK